MDPLRLAIALVPLAAYLLVIGGVNLRKRPLVVSGTADSAALAAALTGMVVVGPLELFMPLSTAATFGAYVWCLLLILYWLCASLAILMMRPRLVIYNTTPETLRPILAALVSRIDTQARWAGRSVSLPNLGIEFHIDAVSFLRNVSLVANPGEQSLADWRTFEQALRSSLREVTVPRGIRGVFFAACAAALLASAVAQMLSNPDAVAVALRQLLRP